MAKSKKRRVTTKPVVPFQPKIDVAEERRRPRLVSLLLCLYFSADTENRHNLIGVFDRLYVNPETHQSGNFIITVRTLETREGEITISILNPAEEVVAGLVYEPPTIDMPRDKPYSLQFHGEIGFQAKTEGIYWIDVSHNGQSLGGTSFIIEFSQPSQENKDATGAS